MQWLVSACCLKIHHRTDCNDLLDLLVKKVSLANSLSSLIPCKKLRTAVFNLLLVQDGYNSILSNSVLLTRLPLLVCQSGSNLVVVPIYCGPVIWNWIRSDRCFELRSCTGGDGYKSVLSNSLIHQCRRIARVTERRLDTLSNVWKWRCESLRTFAFFPFEVWRRHSATPNSLYYVLRHDHETMINQKDPCFGGNWLLDCRNLSCLLLEAPELLLVCDGSTADD